LVVVAYIFEILFLQTYLINYIGLEEHQFISQKIV
jgi:hypothetical protein